MVKDICSVPNKNINSCFDDEQISKIYKIYRSDDKLTTKQKHNYLSKHLGHEEKWLTKIGNENISNLGIKSSPFKPKKPLEWKYKKNAWLSNYDINNYLLHLENIYDEFLMINASPSDYDYKMYNGDYVSGILTKLDLDKILDKGKTIVGVVFNIDTHESGGSHWVALIIDIKKMVVLFQDSVGKTPNSYIDKFIKTIITKGNDLILNNKLKKICGIHSVCVNCTKLDSKNLKIDIKGLDKNNLDKVKNIEKGDIIYLLDDNKQNKKIINDYKLKNKYNVNKYYIVTNIKDNIITVNNNIINKKNKLILCTKTFKTYYNTTKQQKQNTECGVYSVHFITKYLKDNKCDKNTFHQISSNIDKDEDMIKKRDVYWRESETYNENYENYFMNMREEPEYIEQFTNENLDSDDDYMGDSDDYLEDLYDKEYFGLW